MILIYRDPKVMMFPDDTSHRNEHIFMSSIGAIDGTGRGVCIDQDRIGSHRSALFEQHNTGMNMCSSGEDETPDVALTGSTR